VAKVTKRKGFAPSTIRMAITVHMAVSKNRAKHPKMDGENNGKTLFFNG